MSPALVASLRNARAACYIIGFLRMPLDPDLVALLACPQCHGTLVSSKDPEGFACEKCGLWFAVEDGIPDFLLEDATPWPPPRGATA